MSPWIGIIAVLAALGLLGALAKAFQKFLSAELSRKAVHVGMGGVCLGFPWIFREVWPVIVLAALAVAGLAALRVLPALKARFGSVLGGVERQSFGEFYFPVAVAIVFVLSRGNPLMYGIPVLTLTVADSVGALVGGRYGMARYRTDEGLKSAEGSLAFFTAAFLSCHIPLLLFSETGRAETLLISLTAGFLVMLMEAVAWRGQDNLIIPVGMFVLLQIYLPMSAEALFVRLLVMVALVIIVLLWRKRTTLSDSAVLAGALAGYALWALGGWFWLLPPLLLYVVYVRLPAFPADARPVQNLHAVTRVMAGGFFWLILHEVSADSQFLLPFFLCMAAHTGNITTARLRVVKPHLSNRTILLIGGIVPVALFGLLGVAGIFFGAWPPVALLCLPVSVIVSVALFYPMWPVEHLPAQKLRIWASETLIAVLASLPGLLPLFTQHVLR